MIDVPQRCKPERILEFIDYFLELLRGFKLGDAEKLRHAADLPDDPEGFATYLNNLHQQFTDLAIYLKREAIHRNISADGLLNFQAEWNKLFLAHPDTIEALKHFGEYFPEEALIDIVRITYPLRVKVEEEIRVEQEQRAVKLAKPEPTTDGPLPGCRFSYKGKIVDLPPTPWKLLDYIWNAKGRTVEITGACDKVWEHECSDDAIDSAKKKINAALLEVGYPGFVRTKDGRLILDCPPSPTV